MDVKFLRRNIFQRICGIPATPKPENTVSWSYSNGQVIIDLGKVPELRSPWSAVRLEGAGLPVRILVVHAEDGSFCAFRNRCTHFGHRRLDPVPGTHTVQCCSVNKSTYDLSGKRIYGPAKHSITAYPVRKESDKLIITIHIQ